MYLTWMDMVVISKTAGRGNYGWGKHPTYHRILVYHIFSLSFANFSASANNEQKGTSN